MVSKKSNLIKRKVQSANHRAKPTSRDGKMAAYELYLVSKYILFT